MKKPGFRSYISLGLILGALVALGIMISCGGSTTPAPSSMTGTVTTTIGDPPTCSATYSAVYVTITKVTANVNSSAGPTDSGWQTLVDLTGSPKQINLLSLASTTCLLTQLGSTQGLPPGNYQQIRVYLLDNSTSPGPSNNACVNSQSQVIANNCVVPSGGSPQPLLLSSEAQTGLKIPPGQIGGGGISLQANQAADINITFQTCESILREGNGRYRLKPVLHADEVALNNNAISGKVVDQASGSPIQGAYVFLEQPETVNGVSIDRVKDSVQTASDGTFIFCPLQAGTNYDVVVAMTTSNLGVPTTYNATVTTAVPVGSNLQNIPLFAEPTTVGTTTATSSAATISGLITSTNSASPAAGVTVDVTLSALQQAGGSLFVTVPLFNTGTATTTVETGSPMPTSSTATSCDGTTGAGCNTYSLSVPASNPYVAAYTTGTISYTTTASGSPVLYWVNAQAFQQGTSTPDCATSSLPSAFSSGTGGTALTVTPAGMTTSNLSFTGCQ